MNIDRRTWAAAMAAFALAPLAGAALAQEPYPAKPIKWIVPFPPAGAMDVIARTLGEHMVWGGEPFGSSRGNLGRRNSQC